MAEKPQKQYKGKCFCGFLKTSLMVDDILL